MRVSEQYGADVMLGSLQSTVRLATAYTKLNLRTEVCPTPLLVHMGNTVANHKTLQVLPFDAVMAILLSEQSLSARFGHSILGTEKAIATDGYLLNDEVWLCSYVVSLDG